MYGLSDGSPQRHLGYGRSDSGLKIHILRLAHHTLSNDSDEVSLDECIVESGIERLRESVGQTRFRRGPFTGVPSRMTLPLVRACSPAVAHSSVVFPHPLEPDDADELAVCDVEGEVLECVHRAGLPLVHLGRSADLELRRSAHGAQNQPVSSGFAYCMNSTTAPSTMAKATVRKPFPTSNGSASTSRPSIAAWTSSTR